MHFVICALYLLSTTYSYHRIGVLFFFSSVFNHKQHQKKKKTLNEIEKDEENGWIWKRRCICEEMEWMGWDGLPKLNNVSIYREVDGVWGPPFVAVKPFWNWMNKVCNTHFLNIIIFSSHTLFPFFYAFF